MRWRGVLLGAGARPSASSAIELVVLLGALLADSPHTRPVPVSAAASDASARPPTSAPSRSTTRARPGSSACCSTRARTQGIPAVSLWASVPHYVAQPPGPEGDAGADPRRGGRPGRVAAAGRPAPGGARLGARRGRARRAGHRGRGLRARPWRRPRTRPTCPRRAGTPSPASSSATCASRRGPRRPRRPLIRPGDPAVTGPAPDRRARHGGPVLRRVGVHAVLDQQCRP